MLIRRRGRIDQATILFRHPDLCFLKAFRPHRVIAESIELLGFPRDSTRCLEVDVVEESFGNWVPGESDLAVSNGHMDIRRSRRQVNMFSGSAPTRRQRLPGHEAKACEGMPVIIHHILLTYVKIGRMNSEAYHPICV